jgi:hypothetical protein
MSRMTEKMSEASNKVMTDEGVGRPRKGDRFRCQACGMEIQVTADCRCAEGEHVHFHCCGEELQKA